MLGSRSRPLYHGWVVAFPNSLVDLLYDLDPSTRSHTVFHDNPRQERNSPQRYVPPACRAGDSGLPKAALHFAIYAIVGVGAVLLILLVRSDACALPLNPNSKL